MAFSAGHLLSTIISLTIIIKFKTKIDKMFWKYSSAESNTNKVW